MLDALATSKYIFIWVEQDQCFLHTLGCRFLLPNEGTSLTAFTFQGVLWPLPALSTWRRGWRWVPLCNASEPLPSWVLRAVQRRQCFQCSPPLSDTPEAGWPWKMVMLTSFPEWEYWWAERTLCKQFSVYLEASLLLCLDSHAVKQSSTVLLPSLVSTLALLLIFQSCLSQGTFFPVLLPSKQLL